MKKGVARRVFDDAGLPNLAAAMAAGEKECPICHAHPPVTGTHFAGHLGYEIAD